MRELGQAINELYGSVEDVYRELTGDKKVVLNHDGGTILSYSNYFEAGWLSVWTIHMAEGLNELDKVIGKVRSSVEDGPTPQPQGKEFVWSLLHPEVTKLARSRFEATHFADAVETAAKGLGEAVRALVLKAGGDELDGSRSCSMRSHQRTRLLSWLTLAPSVGATCSGDTWKCSVAPCSPFETPRRMGWLSSSP